MTATKATLIIPVENQVRELDPKLLLACVAARRGFSSVIGDLREIDFRIASFPRSLYLCKSMTVRNLKMFQIMEKLGHEIVTWDEEALVHLPPEIYYSRRLSPVAIRYVSHLFAWGEDNAELWRQYPALPPGTPIHVTGNPRNDLLRSELHGFYGRELQELRSQYSKFILVNTNFNHVNAFYPEQNLFVPVKTSGEEPKFGKAAQGMPWDYAEGLRAHKQAIFEAFQQLIPVLERDFPDFTVVVRPHPTESQEIYRQIAARCKRVVVTNEGNVVPWLLAARALVHNGCTTGVEAFVLGVPAVSYRAKVNEDYDCGFYRLPNLLSYQAFALEELRATLAKILKGELGAADGDERRALVDRYLAGLEGPLACERIVDILDEIVRGWSATPPPSLSRRVAGWSLANGRHILKRLKLRLSDSPLKSLFYRHRYPGITLEEMRARLRRFREILGETGELRVEQIFPEIFRISA
jgi:surface carbohydrate biosynthesis protein